MKNTELLQNAKSLRKLMTKQEKHLWYDFLRAYPIKVYRQRIIDGFIVDFYCHKAGLVIEIDGSQHYTPDGREYDDMRSEILSRYNLKVIRFTNFDVDKNFDGVCFMIDKAIKERLTPPSAIADTSPKSGGKDPSVCILRHLP